MGTTRLYFTLYSEARTPHPGRPGCAAIRRSLHKTSRLNGNGHPHHQLASSTEPKQVVRGARRKRVTALVHVQPADTSLARARRSGACHAPEDWTVSFLRRSRQIETEITSFGAVPLAFTLADQSETGFFGKRRSGSRRPSPSPPPHGKDETLRGLGCLRFATRRYSRSKGVDFEATGNRLRPRAS